jgi:hypothetical protein
MRGALGKGDAYMIRKKTAKCNDAPKNSRPDVMSLAPLDHMITLCAALRRLEWILCEYPPAADELRETAEALRYAARRALDLSDRYTRVAGDEEVSDPNLWRRSRAGSRPVGEGVDDAD